LCVKGGSQIIDRSWATSRALLKGVAAPPGSATLTRNVRLSGATGTSIVTHGLLEAVLCLCCVYIRPYDRYIRPESKILVFGRFWTVFSWFWTGLGRFGTGFGRFSTGLGAIMAGFRPESEISVPRGGYSCVRRAVCRTSALDRPPSACAVRVEMCAPTRGMRSCLVAVSIEYSTDLGRRN
jgi:hypothetical protein